MSGLAWIIGSGYLLTSALFFYFPKLLHKPTTLQNQTLSACLAPNSRPLKISHRGSPRYNTENTIEAFRKVFHISDCLQMDVCETADQVLVVHHDSSLRRTCGVDKEIGELRYGDLPRIQGEVRLDFGVGLIGKTRGERIPRLEEVFQIFQGVPMDIELKTPTETAITNFVTLVHKYNRQSDTIIGIRGRQSPLLSSTHKTLTQSQPNPPTLLTFMSDRTMSKLYLSYFLGLLPFLPLPPTDQFLKLPIYSEQYQQWSLEKAARENKSTAVVKIRMGILRVMNFVSKPLIGHLRRRGVVTVGWVCNTGEAMDRARWMGVQGIMSDQPYLLDEYVEKYWGAGKQQ